MADTLIFKIDTTPTVSALQDVNDLLTQSKTKLKELTDAGKTQTDEYIAQTAVVKAYEKEQRSLTNVLVQQTGATKVMTKATEDNIKAGKAQENSIAENRKAYNALYNQLLQTAKPTKEQIATAKQLNTVLKEQEAALGNTSRNVGNYGQGFDELTGKLTSIVPGLKGFQTAQMGVNAAMNANPIGAVVMLLTGLFEIFKSNAVIADQAAFAFEAVNKAFGSIIDTVVDTVSSFDKLTAALANPVKFLFNLGKNAAVAAKEGYEAAKAMDELTVANARTAAAIKSNDRQVQALTKSLKDKTKSEQERIGIANKIADLEIANSDLNKKLAKDYLTTEQLRLKGRTKSAEDEAKLIELESNLKDAADEADIARAQRQTRINILLEKEKTENVRAENVKRRELRAEELKSIDDILAKEEEDRRKRFDDASKRELAAIVRREELIAERIGTPAALIEAENLRRRFLLENAELTATERQNIEIESANKIAKIKDDAYKQDIEAQKKVAEESKQIQTEQIQAIQGIVAGALNTIGSISDILSEVTARKQEELDAALKSGALSEEEYAKQSAELKRKQFEENKAIQLATAVMQGINATLAAYTSGASIPLVGTVTGPLFAALAAAFSAVQIGMIASKQPPRFATGVIGLDGAGTATSDSIDARLSRGESVMTAKATERFAPVLAQMEMAVGNRPNFQLGNRKFATGYIPTTDGGYSDRAMSNEVNNASTMAKMVSDSIAKMPQPKLVYDEFTNFVNNRNQSVNLSEL
jgi:hypothetical protein